jgi:hypothetical protein
MSLYGMSDDLDVAHGTVNTFNERVGKVLKDNFPSRVINPKVTLGVRTYRNKLLYVMEWSCEVIPSSENEAHYYFDGVGTVSSGKSFNEAYNSVKNELTKSNKVELKKQDFQKTFGNFLMPDNFAVSSTLKKDDDTYIYIAEYFIAAAKNGK